MSDFLGVCTVSSNARNRAQRDIERAGFGTRMPSFRVSFQRQGKSQVQVRPLFPGMVFTYLTPGYGALDEIEGVRVLKNGGQPLRIIGRDEERLAHLELGCLIGEFNKVSHRNAAGRFVATSIASSKPKQKKRKCRSITARADRRRKRRAKKRGLRNHTDAPNQVAA